MKIWTKTKKLNLISTKFEPWIYGCFCTEIWYDANETKWFSGEKTEENIRTANDGEVRWGPMNDQKRVQLREKKVPKENNTNFPSTLQPDAVLTEAIPQQWKQNSLFLLIAT